MKRPPVAILLLCASLFLGAGCRNYHYMRDSTPMLEEGRSGYVNAHPYEEYNNMILRGRLSTGMNRSQVYATWGRPDFVWPSDGEIDESWAYKETEESRGMTSFTLRFSHGVLKRIEYNRALPAMPNLPAEEVALELAPEGNSPLVRQHAR